MRLSNDRILDTINAWQVGIGDSAALILLSNELGRMGKLANGDADDVGEAIDKLVATGRLRKVDSRWGGYDLHTVGLRKIPA